MTEKLYSPNNQAPCAYDQRKYGLVELCLLSAYWELVFNLLKNHIVRFRISSFVTTQLDSSSFVIVEIVTIRERITFIMANETEKFEVQVNL